MHLPKDTVRGFTLIELLLSVSIIALIAGMGAPILYSMYARAELDRSAYLIISSARRAQLLARSGFHDGPWGISLDTSSLTLFQGTSFDTRVPSRDETMDLPSLVSVPSQEIVFTPFTGATASTSFTLTASINESRTISVDTYGTIY